ncbi:MAG TPA: LTA synthase family protein, partial [Nitrospirota bacterium]
TFSYFAAPAALCLIVMPDKIFRTAGSRLLIRLTFFAVLSVFLFDAVAEYLFFDEFGTRFNFIAIDYLVYTREVVRNIRESYHLNRLLAGIFLTAVAVFLLVRKHINRSLFSSDDRGRMIKYGGALVLTAALSFAFVDHSRTSVSNNSYANEVAGNGIYDLFAAFRNNEIDYEKFYPTKDESVVFARLRDLVQERNNHLVSDDSRSITREITNPGTGQKLNVIVIVEESLSAEYLGAFGNTSGLTPNLDRLADQSLLFRHLYATGTRTVRGLEAITLSLPPLPGLSLIKRPNNENFFSWGSLMRSRGYDTKFIYAGHGYFDNMNYFFGHNGFDTVDRTDFSDNEITFSNAWGVCDEDLFKKVIREADRSQAARKPFFSMVMTTSNHRPFTYPAGKIDVLSGTGRAGGVKYADYAIGRLIEQAKRRPWFEDTLIVIVADHCAGSAGKTELPVKRYEIPLLVYAPSHVRPGKIDTLASQIDIAPTILGLLNMSYRTKFLGKDILKMAPSQERAFISTYQQLGFIKGDKLLIMGPQKHLAGYAFDRTDGTVRSITPADADITEMISYYEGASYLYKLGLNRIR